MASWSISFAFEAKMKVRPASVVSSPDAALRAMTVSPIELSGDEFCCRVIQEKLNTSSSSLLRRRRKDGGEPG